MIWVLALLVIGVNFAFWGAMGLLRILAGRLRRHGAPESAGIRDPMGVADVAVLMAAHNEQLVIGSTIDAITRHVPARQVHVVSDGSTDDTANIAWTAGVRVYETTGNLGKAGALAVGISRFRLAERFRAVLLLDADTELDDDYFVRALPLFDDPKVVAVAGCATTHWRPSELSPMGMLLVAHRERVYALTQLLMKFGQTGRWLNATHIVPGFASMYRTDILDKVNLTAPGLVIEDFNMTFEVYRKHLGRVGFTPRAQAYTQDPDNLRDYLRQVRRWTLGLWQTLRRHGLRLDVFSGMLALMLLELVTASMVLLLVPLVLLGLLVPDIFAAASVDWAPLTAVHSALVAHTSLAVIALGVLLPDYLLTCLVAVIQRRPRFLLFGLGFVALRVMDAWIALSTLKRAWTSSSTGRWVSPTRR